MFFLSEGKPARMAASSFVRLVGWLSPWCSGVMRPQKRATVPLTGTSANLLCQGTVGQGYIRNKKKKEEKSKQWCTLLPAFALQCHTPINLSSRACPGNQYTCVVVVFFFFHSSMQPLHFVPFFFFSPLFFFSVSLLLSFSHKVSNIT